MLLPEHPLVVWGQVAREEHHGHTHSVVVRGELRPHLKPVLPNTLYLGHCHHLLHELIIQEEPELFIGCGEAVSQSLQWQAGELRHRHSKDGRLLFPPHMVLAFCSKIKQKMS